MEQNSPAVGAPLEPTVRPRAWADDKVMAGHVGNCASDAAKTYWQRSNQFDRMMADKLVHPLYALTNDQLHALKMTVADALIGYRGRPDGPPPHALLAARWLTDSNT